MAGANSETGVSNRTQLKLNLSIDPPSPPRNLSELQSIALEIQRQK